MPNDAKPLPRIAMVVIPGVGDQAQDDSAKAAANLLLTFPRDDSPQRLYAGFDSSCGVHIPVKRVEVRDEHQEPKRGWFARLFWFGERPPYVLAMHHRPKEAADTIEAAEKLKAETQANAAKKAKNAEQAHYAAVASADALSLEAVASPNTRAEISAALKQASALSLEAKHADQEARGAAREEAGHRFDHVFMHDALSEAVVEGSDCTYTTIRLEGWRQDQNGKPVQEVHILDMTWSDLSRQAPSLASFFTEVYLLLFFVCQLGRKSIDSAKARHQHEFWWEAFRQCQAWAERIFTRFISVFNLYLFAAAAILVPVNLPVQSHPFIVLGLTVVATLVAAYWILKAIRFFPRYWPVVFIVGSTLAVLGGCGILLLSVGAWMHCVVLMGWVLAVLVVLWIMYHFNARQPGVFGVALVAGVGITAVFVYHIHKAPVDSDTKAFVDAALWTAEYVWAALACCWLVFGLLGFATGITGIGTLVWAVFIAFRKRTSEAWLNVNHTWRVLWTVGISLTIPPTLFLILTLAFWRALLNTGASWMPRYQHQLTWPFQWLFDKDEASVRDFVSDLIVRAAPPVFYVGFLAFVLLMVVFAWSLLPAILSESTRPSDINQKKSVWLGRSLSAAFTASVVICAVTSVLFLLAGFPLVLAADYWFPQEHPVNRVFLPYSGYILNGLALGIIAVATARGQLRWVAPPVLRSVLDIILDVANWLRHLPAEKNPRNRICARYVSLLRYLCACKDLNDQRGYDAVIILAHSQGCVITADLLRFLKAEDCDPALERFRKPVENGGMRIQLFTMGNPLRQLYSWPFPFFYGWARHDHFVMKPLPTDLTAPDPDPNPDDLLGVTLWVSAYRSGDFVGRQNWRTDKCAYLFDLATMDSRDATGIVSRKATEAVSRDATGKREEFCIGNGAHTHYWDDTAPDIAHRLDKMIDEAVPRRKPDATPDAS